MSPLPGDTHGVSFELNYSSQKEKTTHSPHRGKKQQHKVLFESYTNISPFILLSFNRFKLGMLLFDDRFESRWNEICATWSKFTLLD